MNGVLGKVFSECAKLASKVIDRQKEDETNERPRFVGHDREFGEYAIRGANAGMDLNLLDLIYNLFCNWLYEQFVNDNEGEWEIFF